MTDKKKISLNFGRIGKAQVDTVAAGTLGDIRQAQPSAAPPTFFLTKSECIVKREAELVTRFNFAKQEITQWASSGGPELGRMPFEAFPAQADIAEAYEQLRRMGGHAKPYKGSDSQRQKQEPAKRSRQGRRFLWPF